MEALKCKESMGPLTKRICHQCDCSGADVALVQNFLEETTPFTFRTGQQHNADLSFVNYVYATKHRHREYISSELGLNPGAHMTEGIPGMHDDCIAMYPGDFLHIEPEGLAAREGECSTGATVPVHNPCALLDGF